MNIKQSELLKVSAWPVEKVVPYARNPRKNEGVPVAKVKASLKEFGWRQPIVVDSEGVIIVGHTRYQAALELGMTEIPVHVAEGLTAAQVKAYRIADNKTGDFAEWDFDLLKLEFADLQELDFGLDLTGFDDEAIDGIMVDSTPEGLTDPDEVPDVPDEPVSKPGDVWAMGNHRLMCGDSTSIDAVDVLMAGAKADMVFTDPPYGVDYDGGHAVKGKRREKLANDATPDIYSDALPLAYASSKESAALYLWYSDSKTAAVTAAITAAGYEVRNTLIWNKNLAQFGAIGAQYKCKHEPCIYAFKRGNPPFWCGPTNEVSVWDVARGSKNEFHPTQKPVELAGRAIKNSCPKGGVVLDLFGGSGSTLIACEMTGALSRTMELNPAYCDVIIKRWQDFTGKKAVLEDSNAEG